MIHQLITSNGTLLKTEEDLKSGFPENIKSRTPEYKINLVWGNIIILTYLHIGAIYGLWLAFTTAKLQTCLFAYACGIYSIISITGGAHRLWSHRSYKAKWPLRLFLIIGQTIAIQGPMTWWARDHRVHHKYSDTDADPQNPARGFFFSHIGWLVTRKHPLVKEKGKTIDVSDIYDDPIVAFQKKYYLILMPLFGVILPALIPMYFWNESFITAHFLNVLRATVNINTTLTVNSVAHKFGNKPYDKFIDPVESGLVSFLTIGEGWHNFHHAFPWDYNTSELGLYKFNPTSTFIDLMAKIGLAYDLKTISADMIKRRIEKTGDGSHKTWGEHDKD